MLFFTYFKSLQIHQPMKPSIASPAQAPRNLHLIFYFLLIKNDTGFATFTLVHSALPLCSLWQQQSSDLPVTTFSTPANLATHVHPLRIIPDISSSRNCAYLLFLKLHKENLFQNHSALHILFSHYFETFYICLYFSGTVFH